MLSVVTLFLLGVSGSLADTKHYSLEKLGTLFDEFVQEFHKKYNGNDEEYIHRLKIFRDNVIQINKLNEEGNGVYEINDFADLTDEEFSGTYLGFGPLDEVDLISQEPAPNVTAPASVDWRSKNVVSGVKHQGKCGSCFSFSAIACIESQYAMKTGQLLSLSDQQGLDCDNVSGGCDGGFPHEVMLALKNEGGVMAEKDYPYTAAKGQCRTDTSKVKVHVTGYNSYSLTDEESLKNVVATYGPISIAMFFPSSLNQYSRGVTAPSDCGPSDIANHAVLLVGYSSDANGIPYWLIKNSFGATWGEGGYLRLKMGGNLCKILSYSALATV